MGVRSVLCRVSLCFVVVRFGSAGAQDLTPLIAECASGGSAALLTSCQSAVLAAQAIRGGIAISDAAGAELSGSSSTIGRRLGSTPRVGLDLRFRVARFSMPDMVDGVPGIAADDDVYVYGIKGSVAVGVFDGFSWMPMVGGMLSLDLLASGSLLFLGESDGFSGHEAIGSIGGRLGVFRESFSLQSLSFFLGQSLRFESLFLFFCETLSFQSLCLLFSKSFRLQPLGLFLCQSFSL